MVFLWNTGGECNWNSVQASSNCWWAIQQIVLGPLLFLLHIKNIFRITGHGILFLLANDIKFVHRFSPRDLKSILENVEKMVYCRLVIGAQPTKAGISSAHATFLQESLKLTKKLSL